MVSRTARARSQARIARRALAIAVVAAIAGALPAGAATGWQVATSITPTGASQAYLDAISCTGVTSVNCFAVGSYVSAGGAVRTLIEHSTGTAWKIIASPNRTGAIANALVGVSCSTATSCFAVGNSQATPTAPASTLVERWNGASWTISPTPNVAHSTGNYLDGISCVGPSRCFAVGDFTSGGTAGATLIERWNGASWTIMASPNRAGSAIDQLADVSCKPVLTSVTCEAVGQWSSTSSGSVFLTLVERFNGKSWVVVASPNVGGKYRSSLSAVSCTSATFCMAVGVWQHSPGASLSERWNGETWTLVSVPNYAGFTFSQLDSVSCTSATNCIAVGNWSSGAAAALTLVVHWNGSAWAVVYSPTPAASHGASFAGVSCVGLKCSAVGSYLRASLGDATLAERNF